MADENDLGVAVESSASTTKDLEKSRKRKKEKNPKVINEKKCRKPEVLNVLTMITSRYNDLSTNEKLKCIEYCIRNL
jgi:hypothetical protein